MASDLFRRIKDALPVWVVAERYGKVTRKPGAGRVMPCLFHQEKTASMALMEDHYHCFGCGQHGDIFDLVEWMEKLTKAEAIEFLGHLAGIPQEELVLSGGRRERAGEREERDQYLEILAETAQYLRLALLEGTPGAAIAQEELATRQLPEDLIAKIGFGYAPDAWSNLADHLQAKGYQPDVLVKAGVIVRANSGRPIDFFRHRLVIPIRNRAGRVVSFAGRALSGSTLPSKKDEQGREIAPPKYVNGPETSVFTKGALLFGEDLALSMRDESTWVQVEGYFDATALLAAQVPAIAPMGTALTEAQAKEIGRCAKKVLLWQDPDPAGQKATRKAIPLLLAQGLRVEVVRPMNLGGASKWDPDMVVRHQGPEATKSMLMTTGSRMVEDWISWLIPHLCVEEGLSRSRKQDRLELLRKVAAVLVEGFPELDPPRAQVDLVAMELEVPLASVLGALTSERRNRSQDRLRSHQQQATEAVPVITLPVMDPVIWMALEAMADGDVRGLAMVKQVDLLNWEMLPHGHVVLELLEGNGIPESDLGKAAMAEASARRHQKAVQGDLQLLHILVRRRVLTIQLEELDQTLNGTAACLAVGAREQMVRERLRLRCELQSLGGGHLRRLLQG